MKLISKYPRKTSIRQGKFLVVGVVGFLMMGWGNAAVVKDMQAAPQTLEIETEAQLRQKPEQGVLSVYFTAYSWNVEKARGRLNDEIAAFMEKVKESGADVTTEMGIIQIKPSYQFNREVEGFVPSNFLLGRELRIHFKATQDLTTVLSLALKKSVFIIRAAYFTVDDPTALKKAAFAQALKTGAEQASSYAQSAGATLGDLLTITELETTIQNVSIVEDNLGGVSSSIVKSMLQPSEQEPRDPKNLLDIPQPFSSSEVTCKVRLRLRYTIEKSPAKQ